MGFHRNLDLDPRSATGSWRHSKLSPTSVAFSGNWLRLPRVQSQPGEDALTGPAQGRYAQVHLAVRPSPLRCPRLNHGDAQSLAQAGAGEGSTHHASTHDDQVVEGALRARLQPQPRGELGVARLDEQGSPITLVNAEGDRSPGVLMASGYIAGAAIMGVIIAGLVGFEWDTAIDLSGYLGFLTQADWFAMIPFAVIMYILYRVGISKGRAE